jgi:hypothetical protein
MAEESTPVVVDKAESRRWMAEAFSRIALEEVHIDACTVVAGGTFTKSYTTYDVKVIRPDNQGGTTTVARRYSEFEKTFEALKRRYAASGIFIPPLPTSAKTAIQDDAFKAKRMRGLSICMGLVHRNIFMRYDPLYMDFINPPDAKDGDVAFVDKKSGEARWEEFLPTLPTALNGVEEEVLEKKVASLGDEALKFGQAGENMVRALNAVYATLSANAKAFADLEAATEAWSKKETEEMPMLNDCSEWPSAEASLVCGESPPSHHSVANLTTCSLPLLQTLKLAEEQNKDSLRCLQTTPIEYMLEMNSELKRIIALAADLKKKAAVKWAAYHKLQAKPPKAAANAPEQEGKSEVELSKDAATDATAEWTNFVKVLLLVSQPTIVIERSKLSRECLGSFAATCRLMGSSVADNALHFFKNLNDLGAKDNADSGNWSINTCTSTADRALTDVGGSPLNSFTPGAPSDAAAEEAAATKQVTPVPAMSSLPELANALPAPTSRPTPPPVKPTPPPVPTPPPAAPTPEPAAPTTEPTAPAPEPTPEPAPVETAPTPPAAPASPPAPTVTDSLFGDSLKADAAATADLFGDDDGAC